MQGLYLNSIHKSLQKELLPHCKKRAGELCVLDKGNIFQVVCLRGDLREEVNAFQQESPSL